LRITGSHRFSWGVLSLKALDMNGVQRDELQFRTQWYATLRSAMRAVVPVLTLEETSHHDQWFREIRNWLRGAISTANVDETNTAVDPVLLEKIDRSLDALGAEIFSAVRALPLSEFRAILPTVQKSNPRDLDALLELCLIDPENYWWDLIDYVVTLLASVERDGVRIVSRDPATLTRQLEALCSRAAEEATDECREIASSFEEGCARLERGESVHDVVKGLRATKRRAAERLFVPWVLRTAVDYNVAVGNRLAELSEARRIVDDAEVLSIETNAVSIEDSTPGASLLPLPLEPIEKALRLRLEGGLLCNDGNDAATEIAQALDLTRLAPEEKSAILSDADDRVIATVRATVVLGLVAREATRLEDPLERLCAALEPTSTLELGSTLVLGSTLEAGATLETLCGEWMAAADLEVQAEIRRRILGDDYDAARLLADVRAKFLNFRSSAQFAEKLGTPQVAHPGHLSPESSGS